MAKKIEGWSDPFACFVEGPEKPDEIYCSFFPTTQVVHECDKHERVYTESEVRAMMLDVFRSRSHFELSGGMPGMLIQPGDVEQIAKRHGIVLDPA